MGYRCLGLGLLILIGLGVIACSEPVAENREQAPRSSGEAQSPAADNQLAGGLAAALADEREQAQGREETETTGTAKSASPGSEAPGEKKKAKPPPTVPVRTIEPHEVFVARTYTGRTRGASTVEIRTRVGGVVEERLYEEGAVVAAGTKLFRIDQDPYQARVQKAQANLQSARARQRQAEREWQRVYELYQDNATSGRERDLALSEKQLAAAEVAIAKAELAAVQLELDYTTVEAPLRGVVGLEEQPEGSLIEEGAVLAMITQLDPIHVRFSIPADDIEAHGPQIRSGKGVTVTLTGGDDKVYPEPGHIDFVGATIDKDTGTLDARAVFPNPDIAFLPGEFVRVTLAGLRVGRGFRIPYEAVVKNNLGRAVFVLDDKNIAHRRPVEVAEDLGEAYLIKQGIERGDRVVMAEADKARDGKPVIPRAAGEEPVDKAQPAEPITPESDKDAIPVKLKEVASPKKAGDDDAPDGEPSAPDEAESKPAGDSD